MNSEPKAPYVYQPFGIMDRDDGKLWGVAGIKGKPDIRGVTKSQANDIVEILNDSILLFAVGGIDKFYNDIINMDFYK